MFVPLGRSVFRFILLKRYTPLKSVERCLQNEKIKASYRIDDAFRSLWRYTSRSSTFFSRSLLGRRSFPRVEVFADLLQVVSRVCKEMTDNGDAG